MRGQVIQEIEIFKQNYKSQVIVSAFNQLIRKLKGEKKKYIGVSSVEERKSALESLLLSNAITIKGKQVFEKQLEELQEKEHER